MAVTKAVSEAETACIIHDQLYCMGKGRGGKARYRKFYGREVFFEQQYSEAMHACDRGLQYLIKPYDVFGYGVIQFKVVELSRFTSLFDGISAGKKSPVSTELLPWNLNAYQKASML